MFKPCLSSKKNNQNSNRSENFYHLLFSYCVPGYVYTVLYKCLNSQGGECKETNKSGIKTLLPFKYFKLYYLRLSLPLLNWFHPSFKNLNWSLGKSVSYPWGIVHLPRVIQLCFIMGCTGRGNVDPWSSFPS